MSLLPLIYINKRRANAKKGKPVPEESVFLPGMLAGTAIFTGASLQQAGLAFTSAEKTAFITGLYMALVPLFGIFLKQKIKASTWLGIVVAVAGLYLLSIY